MSKSNAIAQATHALSTEHVAPWNEQGWQKLWLSTREQIRPWRSLALIPAGPGAAPELMLQIAVTLSRTGMSHLGGAIHVADATRIALANLVDFSEEMTRCTQGDDLVLIALAPLADNVTSLSIAQAADCALLCVLPGRMQFAHAKQTVEAIGASHFIGSAFFNPSA